MGINLKFSAQSGNGRYSISYKDGVLNAADFNRNQALVKAGVAENAHEVVNALTCIAANDEVEMISLIELLAKQGTVIDPAS
jgi:hypothetical protein